MLSTEPSGLDPISALLRSWCPSDSAKNPSLFSGRRKDPSRSFGLCVGLSCLPGQAKYCPAVKNSPVDCFRQKKRPKPKRGSLCWHYLSSRAVTRQVLSAQMSLTSVFGMGTGGPSLQSIPTISGDPYRIRTDVKGVRGLCLNHLTNGPFGTPSGTRTQDPLIKSQLLYQLS